MDWQIICGLLTAEASAQLGLAVALASAFWLVRIKFEHLLFAIICLCVATQSIAATWFSWPAHTDPRLASIWVHATLAITAAIHLHYVTVVTSVRATRHITLIGYCLAGIIVALIVSQLIGRHAPIPGIAMVAANSGVFPRLATPAAMVAYSLYPAGLLMFVVCFWFLAASVRQGRHDVVPIMVGMLVVAGATANDICVLLHLSHHQFVFNHAFSVYDFFVGWSLLLRYRRLMVGHVATESSLRARTEELRRSYADLEQVQRELSSKKQLAAVGELAAAIAHEVRNPLAIIVNAVAGLRRPSLHEEDRHTLLGIVDEETARLNRLVTDLLRFARPVSIRRTSVALAELVRRAEVNRRAEHKFEIQVPDDPELRTVQADANLLRLVFDNLVANACQSMPEGGTVRIVVGEGKLDGSRCVSIEVIDHGHGMDETVLSRAVDPFFTTRPSGTGLGLPIVQRIVAAHGGVLQMESEPQQGTTVRLLLPIEARDASGQDSVDAGVQT